uniref:Uncharacterized protein n=1 Tax=Podarcis muralis TaxID=64176 RepID=A0A670ISL8_PODMU
MKMQFNHMIIRVLSEDLLQIESLLNNVKSVYHTSCKRLGMCWHGQPGTDEENNSGQNIPHLLQGFCRTVRALKAILLLSWICSACFTLSHCINNKNPSATSPEM